MEITCCYECGAPISDKWEAFKFMQDMWMRNYYDLKTVPKAHVDKRSIDPREDTNLIPIFEALRIEKYCCRAHFTTIRLMSELRQ